MSLQSIGTSANKFFRRIMGIRMLKTALAVSLSILLAQVLERKMPLMSGLAAVVTMSNTVFDSFNSSLNRLKSTILGVLIASIFREVGFQGFLPTFLGIVIIINICNLMRWHDATSLSLMVFIIVMLYSPGAPDYMSVWEYGVNRVIDTGLGLVIGVLVNIIISPPNQALFILKSYQKTLKDCEEAFIKGLNGRAVDSTRIISDINLLGKELEDVRHDRPFSKNKTLKLSTLSKINSGFYSLAGSITQFTDLDIIPCLSLENKLAINDYFSKDIEYKYDDICPLDLENAYNYQMGHTIELLAQLREEIRDLETKIQGK